MAKEAWEIEEDMRAHFGLEGDRMLDEFRRSHNLQPGQEIPARLAQALQGEMSAALTDCACFDCTMED